MHTSSCCMCMCYFGLLGKEGGEGGRSFLVSVSSLCIIDLLGHCSPIKCTLLGSACSSVSSLWCSHSDRTHFFFFFFGARSNRILVLEWLISFLLKIINTM